MAAFVPLPLAAPRSFSRPLPTKSPLSHPALRYPTATMRVALPVELETSTESPPILPLFRLDAPSLSAPPTRRTRSSSPTRQISQPLTAVRRLVSTGKYTAARAAFADLASESDDAEVLRSWAFLEGSQGDETLARELFTRAIRAANDPSVEAAAWNAWALMEQRLTNIPTARKCFLNGLRVDPTHAPLCQAFAMFEAKYGVKRRARELFARGAELNNSSHRTWIAWANFEAAEDNMARARFLFRTACTNAQEDDGITALLSFARFEEKQKLWQRARDLYMEGLRKYGHQCAKLLHAWGRLESRSGNYEKSKQLFLATLACPGMTGPAVAPTYQAWALAEKRAGNIQGARKLFQRGADANPNHVYIWQAWGIMEQRCKNFEAARLYFKKGVEADPSSAPTWNAWARLEAERGHIEEARRLYRKATDSDCLHAQSWQAWAVLEGKHGNLDTARALFQKAVSSNPTCAPAWQAWACMEESAGNYETARDLFQKGVDANPMHIAVWQAWSDMEQRLGNFEKGPSCSLPPPGSH